MIKNNGRSHRDAPIIEYIFCKFGNNQTWDRFWILGAHTVAPQQPYRTSEKYGPDNKQYNATIGNMMDWFKTMSTNEYIRGVKTCKWKRFDRKLWQVNYWEHIIRNQQSDENISGYIVYNPTRWKDDQFYME